MLLPEDDILLRAGQGSPRAHPPLKSSPDAGVELGMSPSHLLKNRNGADPGRRPQDRYDLRFPYVGKRIRPSPARRGLFLRRQAWIIFDPVGARRAQARLGGGNGDRVGLTVTHVQPHLVVVDVEAG